MTTTEIPATTALYIGPRLKQLRVWAGLMQSELSRKLDVDASIVSLWERNLRPVPHNRVAALAAALKTTPANVLYDAEYRTYGWERQQARALKVADEPIEIIIPKPSRPIPPLKHVYTVTCLLCSNAADVRWTRQHAALELAASRLRCGMCGAGVLISEGEVGHIASPIRAHMGKVA